MKTFIAKNMEKKNMVMETIRLKKWNLILVIIYYKVQSLIFEWSSSLPTSKYNTKFGSRWYYQYYFVKKGGTKPERTFYRLLSFHLLAFCHVQVTKKRDTMWCYIFIYPRYWIKLIILWNQYQPNPQWEHFFNFNKVTSHMWKSSAG